MSRDDITDDLDIMVTGGNISYPSKNIFTIKIPEPPPVKGYYRYNYYMRDEMVNDKASTIPAAYIERYGFPRSIRIQVNNPIAYLDGGGSYLASAFLNHPDTENYLFNPSFASPQAQNEGYTDTVEPMINKITSVTKAQSTGYVTLTPNEPDSQKLINSNLAGSKVNALTALLAYASNTTSKNKKFIREVANTSNKINNNHVYLNPSTGTPDVEAYDNSPNDNLRFIISRDFTGDVIKASSRNSFSAKSAYYHKEYVYAKNIQSTSRLLNPCPKISEEEYMINFDTLNDSDTLGDILADAGPGPGIGIIGYVIFKDKLVKENGEDKRVPRETYFLIGHNKQVLEDYNITHNTRYEYSVHTLAIMRIATGQNETPGSGVNYGNSLIVSAGGKKLIVKTTESVPPPAPESIKFSWTGSGLRMDWSLPLQINSAGGPINDIKGFQIFYRKGIKDNFRLLKMLDFNKTISKMPRREQIPPQLISRSNNAITKAFFNILKDKDYIFSMCSIDAHGNSSTYSTQYRVRYISNQNRIRVNLFSYPGAPKAYPNYMISSRFFNDSLSISGFKRCNIYYQADSLGVNIENTSTGYNSNDPGNIILHEASGRITPGYVGSDNIIPKFSLQFIDIATQKDQIVNMFITDDNVQSTIAGGAGGSI